MALNAGPTKRMNGPSGRVRNSATEVAGKNGGRVPGVPGHVKPPTVPGLGADYGSAAGITGQLAGSYAAFQNTVAAMRAQRVGLRAGFKTAKANIRAEGIGAMSEAINGSIESGMLGSSAASQAQIGVVAGVKTDIEAARGDLKQQVLASKVQEQQAYMDYQITQEQMAMQAEAARQANAIAEAQLAATEAGNANMQQILGQYLDQGKTVIDPTYNANFKAATGHELTLGENGSISVQGAAGNLRFAAGTDPAVVLSETKRYFANLDRIIARKGG